MTTMRLTRQAGSPSSISARDTRTLLGVALLALGVFSLLVVALQPRSPSFLVVAFSTILLVFAVSALFLMGGRAHRGLGLGEFRIGPWFAVWYGLCFGLTSFAWRQQQVGTPGEIAQSSVVGALGIAMLGLGAWTAGYLLGVGASVRRFVHRRVTHWLPGTDVTLRSPNIAWALYLIGLCGRAMQFMSGGYGYLANPSAAVTSASRLGQLLPFLASFASFALIVAAVDFARSRSRRSRGTLIVMAALEVGFGLTGGTKVNFVLTMLGLVAVLSAARLRLPKKTLAVILIMFLFVVAPFTAAYRAQIRSGATTLASGQAIATIPQVVGQMISTNPFAYGQVSLRYLGQRLREIDNIAIIYQRTPSEIPYRGVGQLIIGPATAFIPRILWPGKPLILTGYNFSQQYYQLPSNVITSSAITPEGDLFRYAGIPAVIVGMLLFGALARLVDRELHPVNDLRYALFFVPLFAALLNIETGIVAMVAGLPISIVAAMLAGKIAFKSSTAPGGTKTPQPLGKP